jgi:Putative Flp pilus-assembly TadE/G-like
VAVVVAICMVVLMDFLAIAVDLGSIYSDKQQLQNGADAGALAIAESCQRDPTKCSDSANNDIADKYAQANKLDGQATGTVVRIDRTAGKVTVEARTPELHPHQNWFAGVLGKGMSTTDIRAYASATWGYPLRGTTMPLIFSWCEFFNATGGWKNDGSALFPKDIATVPLKEKECTNPAHTYTAGGFGWLDATGCRATVWVGQEVGADTGLSGPSSCTDSDWIGLRDNPISVPIFDNYQGSKGSGSKAMYTVKGVAEFTVEGYCFGNLSQWKWPENCTGDSRGIRGYFTKYTILSDDLTFGSTGTDLGAGGVNLIPTEMPVA